MIGGLPAPASLFAPAFAMSAVAISWVAPGSASASVLTAVMAGALAALRTRLWPGLAAGVLPLLALVWMSEPFAPYPWIAALLLATAALVPARIPSTLMRVPALLWAGVFAAGMASLVVALSLTGPAAVLAGMFADGCAALLAFLIGRQIVVPDARALVGGDRSVALLTRDLLLGRITSGMLHDLSQPLNVIAMANGNLGYIIDRLTVDNELRDQLTERTRRIAQHTDRAAQILGLFRWFGRDGNRDQGLMTIGTALDRAIGATKSDQRHGGVSIQVCGDALDYPVLLRHGTIEMLAVAALLNAFRAFARPYGTPASGGIVLDARQTAADIVISVICTDTAGQPFATGEVDQATMWLVAEVARQSGGDFRHIRRRNQPLCFVMRFARDMI